MHIAINTKEIDDLPEELMEQAYDELQSVSSSVEDDTMIPLLKGRLMAVKDLRTGKFTLRYN